MIRGVTFHRGLSCSSLFVTPLWRALGPELNPRVKATVTLLGAGTVGAYIVFKIVSKLLTAKNPASDPKQDASISALEDQLLTVPGLQNTGNSCFLNVILQALASSEALLSFMDACASMTTETDSKSQGEGSSEKVAMPLAVAVSSLIKELSQVEPVQRSSSPRRVMLALNLYVQHFDLHSQQDAAEALIHLASALQEERGKFLEWLRPTFQSFVEAPVLHETRSVLGVKTGSDRTVGGDQVLDSWRGHLPWPLEGTIASSLTCQKCGHHFSTQFQSFNDVTLTPLCDREGNLIRACSLESCLDHFTRPEWVESVKCSSCSHKAALLSILLNSGDSVLTPVEDGRTGALKVSRSKVKYIEECGCDEDCKCESFTGEEGGVWRNIYTNATKQLKIGRSPQVICFQIQRVTMTHDGAIKKLTGHVTFPRVLDLFPYTVAAKDSTPLREHINKNSNEDPLFHRERGVFIDSSYHSSFSVDGGFVNMPPGLRAEVSCKGGADLGHPAAEDLNTMDSEETELSREATKADDGGAGTGRTHVASSAFPSISDRKEDEGSLDLSTVAVKERGLLQIEDTEDSALPSGVADSVIEDIPQREEMPMDNPSVLLDGIQEPGDQTKQSVLDPIIKPTTFTAGIMETEMVSNHRYELIEEFQLAQTIPLENGDISSTSWNGVQSVYSQYTPRVFPPILQQLSSFASVYEDQQVISATDGYIKQLPNLRNMPRKTIRLTPKNPTYSRKLLYQLVSVVVHQGGPQNGHYLVYRKVRIRGSKSNQINDELLFPKVSINGPRYNGNPAFDSAETEYVPNQQAAIRVSGAEGDKVQADVCKLFELDSLPDITSSERIKQLRSRVQASEGHESGKWDARYDFCVADKSQIHGTDPVFSEECTNCTGVCGRREDSDALWFRISDTKVQRVQEQEVFDAQASLLFYEQL